MALHEGPLVFLTDGSDGSLAALPDIAALARELECAIRAVYVDSAADPKQPPSEQQSGPAVERLRSVGAAQGLIDRVYLAAPAQLTAAIREAASTGLVVFRANRAGRIGRRISGGSYQRLLRSGPLPLLVLPASSTLDPLRRVLFPADLSPRSEAALDEAIGLCRKLAAELHVLHVYGDDRLLPSERDQARRAAARSPLELLRIDQQRIAELVARATSRNVRAHAHTAEGRAHTEILRYAVANGINAIVMPSHGPRTLEDIVFGSTTMRVIARAPMPVLALRGTSARDQPPFSSAQAPE